MNLDNVAVLARTSERLRQSTMPREHRSPAPGTRGPGSSQPFSKIPVPPYDQELPPGYWQNLVPRKQASACREAAKLLMASMIYSGGARSLPVFGWVAGLSAFVLVAGALAWVTNASTHLNQNGYHLESMGEPNVQPSPPRGGLHLQLAQKVRVLRAALVTPRRIVKRALPARSLPDPAVGVSFEAHMPYGETVHATFMGRLPSQASLPSTGAFIGETLAIGNQEFVWAAPFGGVPQWIDP